jgi:hypothetical protein
MVLNKGVWILIVIFITTLVISLLTVNRVPVYEGLTTTELAVSGPIKKAMQDYKNTVDKNCQEAIAKVATVQGLSQMDSITLSPIIGNENTTHSYKIQQIVAMNSETKGLRIVLSEVMGKNYSALVELFQTLPTKTSDTIFDRIVAEQYAKLISVITDTNVDSPYAVLDDHIKTAS